MAILWKSWSMNTIAVKELSLLFREFGAFIHSDKVRHLSCKLSNGFTRICKFSWYDVLFYLFLRFEKCTLLKSLSIAVVLLFIG